MTFKKSIVREWTEAIFVAGTVALIAHTFIAKPFAIPSGSMENNLQIGDMVFVNRYIYWFSTPKRGDIIVFKFPGKYSLMPWDKIKEEYNTIALDQAEKQTDALFPNPIDRMEHKQAIYEKIRSELIQSAKVQWDRGPHIDFIKRCIAVAGDTVDIRDDKVYINGKALVEPYIKEPMRTNPANKPNVTFPYVIPFGYVFAMGDNRNNSWDSRYWGPVNLKFLKGKAFIMHWYSRDREGNKIPFQPWKPWTLWRIRLIR